MMTMRMKEIGTAQIANLISSLRGSEEESDFDESGSESLVESDDDDNHDDSSDDEGMDWLHGLERPPRNPASNSHGRLRSGVDLFGRASRGHIATLNLASCLGRDRAGRSNRTESAENRCAQRRHGLERHPRNPASNSHGRLRSGVDLFGRASRGLYRNPKNENLAPFFLGARYCGTCREQRDVDPGGRTTSMARLRATGPGGLGIDVLGRHARGDRRSRTTTATATTPATCACTPTVAGRGPSWAPTSTARLRRATTSGSRYRCHRTARAWRSALYFQTTVTAPERRPRARVRGERRDVDPGWAPTSTARLRATESGWSVSMSSDGTRVAIGAPQRRHRLQSRPRARVRRERRDVDPGGRRHRRRGCGQATSGHHPRYRCPRTARAWRSALPTTTAPAPTPATCACTPRAAGRGPRWAPTSTARLRATARDDRYRCPRTARAWRSALPKTMAPAPPATCACTRRAGVEPGGR